MNDSPRLPEERDLPVSRLRTRKEHLLSEITNQQERRPILRRPLVRGAAIAVSLALVALVVLSVVDVFGPNGPSIVDKAEAALAAPENMILHFVTSGSQDNGDGTTASWSDETWQMSSSPFAGRRIETMSDSPAVETARNGDGFSQIYDPTTNTIYQIQEAPDAAATVAREMDSFRNDALALLNSEGAKVEEHVTIDGRDAIRIVSADGNLTYVIDAKTSEPIEWQTKGDGGSVTMHVTLERLPTKADNLSLVDLAQQHPGATVDSDPAHYQDAMAKGFPKG